ncbi:hypothetical protein [Azospirillum argentinense]
MGPRRPRNCRNRCWANALDLAVQGMAICGADGPKSGGRWRLRPNSLQPPRPVTP